MPHVSDGMKDGLAYDADLLGMTIVMAPIFGLTGGGVPRGAIILSFMFLPAGAAVTIGLPVLKRLGHPFTPPPWTPPPRQE